MSRVNRPPLGLQGLLGSQNFGDNPDELLQGIRPSLDLLPFLGSGLLKRYSITGSRATAGSIVKTGDHVGEAWYVLSISVQRLGAINGTDVQSAIDISYVEQDTGVVDEHILAVSPQQTLALNQEYAFTWEPKVPLLIEPYVNIGARWLEPDNATRIMTLSVLYYAFPI